MIIGSVPYSFQQAMDPLFPISHRQCIILLTLPCKDRVTESNSRGPNPDNISAVPQCWGGTQRCIVAFHNQEEILIAISSHKGSIRGPLPQTPTKLGNMVT